MQFSQSKIFTEDNRILQTRQLSAERLQHDDVFCMKKSRFPNFCFKNVVKKEGSIVVLIDLLSIEAQHHVGIQLFI